MIEHRHAEQLRGGDGAGEGGKPEVQPQRREDDENEIDHRRDEAERGHRSHAVDMQRQRHRRHRRLDQRADIAAVQRQVASPLHVPLDRTVHPPFEQDERSDDGIQIERRKIAVPDPADRLGCKEVDDRHDDAEHHGSGDQRLDAQQFGLHHLLHQRVLEVGRHSGVLVLFLLPQNPVIVPLVTACHRRRVELRAQAIQIR